MRKLYLASFRFRTGENQYDDYSLIAIDDLSPTESETFLSKINRAYNDIFFPWFLKEYPESECVSFVLKPTIPYDTAHYKDPE